MDADRDLAGSKLTGSHLIGKASHDEGQDLTLVRRESLVALINGRYSGQAYRYVYSAHWGNDVTFGPAMKHDMHRQTTEVHEYGRGRMTSEPVFVRKPGASVEDEGWIPKC